MLPHVALLTCHQDIIVVSTFITSVQQAQVVPVVLLLLFIKTKYSAIQKVLLSGPKHFIAKREVGCLRCINFLKNSVLTVVQISGNRFVFSNESKRDVSFLQEHRMMLECVQKHLHPPTPKEKKLLTFRRRASFI